MNGRPRGEIWGVLLIPMMLACSRKAVRLRARGAEAPSLNYEMRLGRGVFVHYCQTCHGETGAGDGFNAFNLDPHPRDLSDPAFQAKKTNAVRAGHHAARRGRRRALAVDAALGAHALQPPDRRSHPLHPSAQQGTGTGYREPRQPSPRSDRALRTSWVSLRPSSPGSRREESPSGEEPRAAGAERRSGIAP